MPDKIEEVRTAQTSGADVLDLEAPLESAACEVPSRAKTAR